MRQSTNPSPLVSTRRRLHPSRPRRLGSAASVSRRGSGLRPEPQALSRGTGMRSKYLSGFLLAIALAAPLRAQAPRAAGPPISAPLANVRYEVTFDSASAAQRTLKASVTFDVGGPGHVLLSFPAWTPGSYEIANFARFLTGFTATGGDKALDWDKLDYDTWRIDPAGARTITVRFDYRAETLDNAASWSRPDFAFFNGTNL